MTASLIEPVPDFDALGLDAFTTTRQAGSFRLSGEDADVGGYGRWLGLQQQLAATGVSRLAMGEQVHGAHLAVHGAGWSGWLRVGATDGHLTTVRGTAMAVTIADCVPIFLGHPSGAGALLHAGWRGVAAGLLEHAVTTCAELGLASADLVAHFGPAICGRCYEVGPEVHAQLTGRHVAGPAPVDLRAELARRARVLGIMRITTSESCTRCDQARFYSHRGGDRGRQVAVLATAR